MTGIIKATRNKAFRRHIPWPSPYVISGRLDGGRVVSRLVGNVQSELRTWDVGNRWVEFSFYIQFGWSTWVFYFCFNNMVPRRNWFLIQDMFRAKLSRADATFLATYSKWTKSHHFRRSNWQCKRIHSISALACNWSFTSVKNIFHQKIYSDWINKIVTS